MNARSLDDLSVQAGLVAALAKALDARVIETHISFVLLTGRHALKIKKAIDLGFLDFRALASRAFYCEEELRLNRRLAPDIYLDIAKITGSASAPTIDGEGPVIEYAVRMREFPQEALATRMLAKGEITPAFVDELAGQIAMLHSTAAVADERVAHGDLETIREYAIRNFERIAVAADDPRRREDIEPLRRWTIEEFDAASAAMNERRARGCVRECHGDLHLGNIAGIDGRPVVFDCIEFNDDLRWIDVMSEVAFLVMDFHDRGRSDLGHRFLNAYLEITGDYGGLRVLRFYLVYRAMVRAMVASERAAQLGNGKDGSSARAESAAYLDLARRFASAHDSAILLMHGFSGSGKTTLSQSLVEAIAGVRIRTDVERKRLHGIAPTERGSAEIYSTDASRQVYLHVLELARTSAMAGFATVVDGAFLRRPQRQLFRDLASRIGVPFTIVSVHARDATLRARILARAQRNNDASDADLDVLEQQLRHHDPLDASEALDAIAIDAEAELAPADRWREVLDRLAQRRRAVIPTSRPDAPTPRDE